MKEDLQTQTEEIYKKLLDNWTVNYLILYPSIDSQLYIMKKRAYCKMMFVTSSTSSRFVRYKNKTNKSFEDFLIREEDFNKLTQNNFMMNHSKYFIDNSSFGNKDNLKEQLSQTEELRNQMIGIFRPSNDLYFMKIAYNARARSNCMKRAVGTVIVKNKRILSIGYNGTPVKVSNCYEGGCERCNQNYPQGEGLDKCFCLHSEESAILEIGGKMTRGATLYSTLFPCLWCAKMIIQSQIDRVVYVEEFNSEGSRKILKESKIKIEKLEYEDRVN